MYTLELYKTDARTKAGERLVEKRDGCGALGSSKLPCELHYAKMYPAPKWRVETARDYGHQEEHLERC